MEETSPKFFMRQRTGDGKFCSFIVVKGDLNER